MFSLVGKLLVITGAGSKLKNGNWIGNYGHWSVLESPSGNGDDWRIVESGMAEEPEDSMEKAQAWADVAGVAVARGKQRDETLEPVRWAVPFPPIPK